MYRLEFSRDAEQYFDRLDRATQRRTRLRLLDIRRDPLDVHFSKPLHGGLAPMRSSRIGGYRILFRVDGDRMLVIVMDIGPRGDIDKQ